MTGVQTCALPISPEEGDAAYRELLDQVAQTVRRNQGTGGVPGAEAVAARMVPGRRWSAVRTALNELLEMGVLQNLGDRRRPRFFCVDVTHVLLAEWIWFPRAAVGDLNPSPPRCTFLPPS